MSIPLATRTAYINGTIADAVEANANEDAILAATNAAIADLNSAAGGASSLPARLSVSLENSGALKSPQAIDVSGSAASCTGNAATTSLLRTLNRGTAAPSGGTNGDVYFQYE